jgi:hypothetical protein
MRHAPCMCDTKLSQHELCNLMPFAVQVFASLKSLQLPLFTPTTWTPKQEP